MLVCVGACVCVRMCVHSLRISLYGQDFALYKCFILTFIKQLPMSGRMFLKPLTRVMKCRRQAMINMWRPHTDTVLNLVILKKRQRQPHMTIPLFQYLNNLIKRILL